MRGDIIYQVFGLHEGRVEDIHFGAFRTFEEAQAEIASLKQREDDWAARYHNKGFVVREKIVDVDFELPSLPKPRHKYFAKTSSVNNRPGTWDSSRVVVCRRGVLPADDQEICEYNRDYDMLQTFEPFRQAGRDFALISTDYTRTSVLDLATGHVIAEEEPTDGCGFCSCCPGVRSRH